MAEFKNMSYNRGNKHRGEHGNLVCDAIKVEIPPTAVAGDILLIDDAPFETLYVSSKIARGAMTAGLTVTVGARELQGGSTIDAALFGNQAMTAPGSDEQLDTPLEVRDADGRKINHDVFVTLGGTVTPGESFWVVLHKIHGGAPL